MAERFRKRLTSATLTRAESVSSTFDLESYLLKNALTGDVNSNEILAIDARGRVRTIDPALLISSGGTTSANQLDLTVSGTTSPLLIQNNRDETLLEVNSDGVLILGPNESLPSSVYSGIVYVSGSSTLEEGFYLGEAD